MNRKEYAEQLLPLVENVLPMAIRMLGCNARAEDVVQDVMLSLWEKRNQLIIKASYKSFLYRAVQNKCLDELKKRKAQQLDVSREENLLAVDSYEFDTMDWIAKCIRSLPEVQQNVINMREIDGLEFHEISEILDLKEAHVRVLLSRAKKELQNIIPRGLK